MLDIKFVRENPDVVDKACESRQNAHWDRDRFFELDEERRSVISEVEKLQAERNAVSKQIGQLMRDGKKDEAEAAKAQVAANKDRIAALDDRRTEVEDELFDLVSRIPNIPHESVPYGRDDSDNPEVRRWGTPRDFASEGFEPQAHWDLGPSTGMIDFDRGVKISGTRFYVLGGMAPVWSVPSSASWWTCTSRRDSRSGGCPSSPTMRPSLARVSCPSSRTTSITSSLTCTSSPRRRLC